MLFSTIENRTTPDNTNFEIVWGVGVELGGGGCEGWRGEESEKWRLCVFVCLKCVCVWLKCVFGVRVCVCVWVGLRCECVCLMCVCV